MANGDSLTDRLKQSYGGTAVAEPEEPSSLTDRLKQSYGASPSEPKTGKFKGPSVPPDAPLWWETHKDSDYPPVPEQTPEEKAAYDQVERDSGEFGGSSMEESDAAKARVTKPFATIPTPGGTPTQQAEKLGLPMLPFDPVTSQPRMVRGQFGQPIPPQPIQEQLDQEASGERLQREAAQQEQARQAGMDPATRFAIQTVKNVGESLSKPPTHLPGGLRLPGDVINPVDALASAYEGPGTMRPALEEFASGRINRAMLKSASDLLEPDNMALAAGMEGLPPGLVSSAAGKIIMGAGFTVPQAISLIHTVPAMRQAIEQEDWDRATEIAAGAIPTIAFTAAGMKDIYEGIADGVNIVKEHIDKVEAFNRGKAEYERRQAEARPKLGTGEAAAAPAAAEEPPSPEAPAEQEPAPETPPARRAAKAEPEPEPEATAPFEPEIVSRQPGREVEPQVPEREPEPVPEPERTRELPAQEDLSRAIAESGQDPVFAERRSKQLLAAASGEEGYTGVERRTAARLIDNYIGPEARTARAPEGAEPVEIWTDSHGVRYAGDRPGVEGGIRITIPKTVRAADAQEYARGKLAEQEQMQSAIRAKVPQAPARPEVTAPQELPSEPVLNKTETEAPAEPYTRSTRETLPSGATLYTGAEGASREISDLENELADKRGYTPEKIARLRRAVMDYRDQEGITNKDELWEDTYRAMLRRALSENAAGPQDLAPAQREELAPPESTAAAEPIARYRNEQEGTEATVTKTPRGYAVNLRDTDSGNDLGVARIFPDKVAAQNHAQGLVNRFENIPAEPEPESATLAPPEPGGLETEAASGGQPSQEAEVPTDEQPTEPTPAEERISPLALGQPSERALEEVPSEDVQGTTEPGFATDQSGGSSGADAERSGLVSGRGVRPSGRVGSSEGEVSVPAERGGRAEPGREPGQLTAGNRSGHDYRITERDGIGAGGERTKYRANVNAIRTLKQLELDGRLATPAEQQILVKYTGWGGIASNQLWNSDTKGGKNWATEYQELKDLLSPEEYTRGRASTTNAHYTSLPVVQAIWDAARRLGFRDGKMLEPSAGIGHFLGIEPSDLAVNTDRTAVELDEISGRILKQLYQSADVRIQNFGDFQAPNDRYDLAVGNVPFGKIIVNDPAYNKHKLTIHNYFILKTLDKLRPGGVAALITSAHTLDSMEGKHRTLFANRADLIGAIRLPNNAFKGNAGTEVTTDILFFKKREHGAEPGGESFQSLKTIESSKGEPMQVNEYFERHPEMMMGKMELAGTMHAKGEPALIAPPEQDLRGELAKAIEKLPENVLTKRDIPDSATVQAAGESIPDWKETKPDGLAIKNGKVYRRAGEAMEHQADFPKAQVQVLKGMLDVRDAARELLRAEALDRPQRDINELMRVLNSHYDRFVARNGIIHARRNRKTMQADPDLPLVLSLENYDPETKKATKADIFSKSVVTPPRRIEKADNTKDAMLIGLAETGRLDFERMSELTGKPEAELQSDLKAQGLAFHTPDGHWETSDVYLSGNVRRKLAEAETAAATNPTFNENVEALRAVIPADVEPSKIFVKLGASWLPNRVVRDFAAHILGLEGQAKDSTKIRHDQHDASWELETRYGIDTVKNKQTWGTSRASAEWLLQQGLNQKVPTIWDTDSDGNKTVNQKETIAAQQKLADINTEMHRWLFEDSEHGDAMARLYNDQFNAEVEWHPDGSHLTLPGSNPGWVFRDYQKNAIWRGVQGKTNLLLAHEVGLGKSAVMAGIAMEWRRLGLKKKPVIVVPSKMVEQFRQDFLTVYPMANLLAADQNSFEKLNRKEFINRIGTGDWDSVIIGDSQFGRLPAGAQVANARIEAELQTAREKLEEAKADREDRLTIKNIEANIANYEATLDRYAAEHKKDDVLTWDQLGVDGLMVDEAHLMKSLPFATKMGRVRGIPNSKSQRAMDTYIKASHITKLNNGNGVIFATGTPITNTIAEAWIMAKFLDEKMLQELGMEHFDSWAATFGQAVTKPEGYPEDPSKLRMMTRFSEFNNLPEVSKIFRRTADIRYADDVGLPRPKMVGGQMQAHEIEPSEAQRQYVATLVQRAQLARGRKPEPGTDNMLVIVGDGRKAAIDLRMVDPDAADDPDSKLNQTAQEVARMYHETREQKLTQLVVLDLRHGEGDFDAYNDLRRKMMDQGVPKNQIAFVQDYQGSVKKQGLFNQVNRGDVAIVIGSSNVLGVGVNVQKRLAAIHRVDPPYRPDWVEQVNGRGIRFGNMNKEVLVRNYVTKAPAFDVYMWHLLTEKNKFITNLMKGDPTTRSVEDVGGRDLNLAEMEAIAANDPRLYRRMELQSEIQKLDSLASSFRDAQFTNRAKLARLPEEIAETKKRTELSKQDQELWDQRPEKFAMTVKGKGYSDRREAGDALNRALQESQDRGTATEVGKYAGFSIMAAPTGATNHTLRGKRSWDFSIGQGAGEEELSGLGTIQSIERVGQKIEKAVAYGETQAPQLEKEMADRKKQVDKKFDRQKELDNATKELVKLEHDLGLDDPNVKNADDGHGADVPEAKDDDEEPPDDLVQSFLGLQNIYNRISRILRRARANRRAAAEAAAGGEPPRREPPRGPVTMPMEPGEGREPMGFEQELRDLQADATPKMRAERAGNIRLDKLNTSEDVLNLIRETAKTHAARINAQRRGKLSDKQLRQRMEEVGLDAEKLMKLKKGTALNEAEMQVAIGIMLDKGEQVREAARKVQADNSTANLLEAQRLHNEYVAIHAAVSGAKAESGRALRIQRMISEAFQSKEKSNYERVLDSLGGRILSEKEAELLLRIPADDRVAYAKFLRDHARFTTAQKIMAYWINNILSGPGTIQRKILGDAAMTALNLPMRFTRAMVDPLMARMQRRPQEYFMREAVGEAAAWVGAVPEGLKAGAFQLWNGFDLKDAAELDLPIRYELPGGLAMNWPTRLLSGATAMFKTIHFKSNLYGMAMRQALKDGFTGRAAGARAAEIVANPPDEMVSKAWEEASKLALVERPDPFLRRLLTLRDTPIPKGYPGAGMAPLKFVIPFATIGWNIAKQAGRYSPAGAARLLSEDTRKSPEASTVLAQALVGTLIMSAIAYWATEGNITGGAPKSAQDRDAWFRSGKQPFSVKVGSRWVSYTKGWGPMALLTATVAGMHDAYVTAGTKPGTDQIGQVAGALLAGIRDQSFFRGIQNLDQAISEPERFGAQWLSEIASGFIPFSGFDRAWANSLDPEIREPQGIYERVISGLPVISRQVPPRLDVLGRPTTRRGGEGALAFLATPLAKDEPESEIDAELARLHDAGMRNPGFAGRFVTIENMKVPMNRKEQNEYQAMRGAVLRGVLSKMFQSQDYQQLSEQDKVSETEQVIRDIDSFARDEMISRLVERRLGPKQPPPTQNVELPMEVPNLQ